jgi:hypothetical protein
MLSHSRGNRIAGTLKTFTVLKRDSKLLRFWNEDRSLSVMLLLLLAFIFVLVPLLNRGRAAAILLRVIYSAVLFTGILSVAKNKRYLIVVSILAAIALVVNWLVQVIPGTADNTGARFFSHPFYSFLCADHAAEDLSAG